MSQSKSVSELLHFLLPLISFCSDWLMKMSLIWFKFHLFASQKSLKDKKKSSVKISGHKDRGRAWISGSAVTFRVSTENSPRVPARRHVVGESLTQPTCIPACVTSEHGVCSLAPGALHASAGLALLSPHSDGHTCWSHSSSCCPWASCGHRLGEDQALRSLSAFPGNREVQDLNLILNLTINLTLTLALT